MDRFEKGLPRWIMKKDGGWFLVTRLQSWEEDKRPHGYSAGDCLWWTSMAAYTYKRDKKFLEGVRMCTPKYNGGKWRRYPWGQLEGTVTPFDDMTRDQLIMAIMALGLLDHDAAVEAIVATKFRLSKKTFLRLDLWFWLLAVKHKSKVYAKLWATLASIKGLSNLVLAKITKDMLGYWGRQLHPNDVPWETPMSKTGEFIQKWLRPKMYPTHLNAWMAFTMNKLGLTKAPILGSIYRATAGKYNYLVALLTGKKLNKSVLIDYEARSGWLWQGYLDRTSDISVMATDEEAQFNALDKDVLFKIWNNI